MQETAPVMAVSVRELHLGRRLQLGRWGVWVECNMLGVTDAPLRTPAKPASEHVSYK